MPSHRHRFVSIVVVSLAFTGCGPSSVVPSVALTGVSARPSAAGTPGASLPSVTPSPSVRLLEGTILFPLEYGVDGADGSQLFTVHPDGTGLTQLTELSIGFATSAAWAPDHRRVVFELSHPMTEPSPVHIDAVGATGGEPTELTAGDVSDGSPTVLPDGRIVFARATAVADPAKNGGAPYTPSSIFVMDPDGSKIRQLTHGTGEDGDWRPKASPDGDRILFLRNGAIEVMDADGTHVRDVVPDAKAEVANWSPDATRIVYGDERGTSIVSVDGRSPVVIGGVADPSWSPDGSLIVGTYWPPDAHFVGVATMKPDGSDIHVLWHPEPNKDIFPQTPVWIADQS